MGQFPQDNNLPWFVKKKSSTFGSEEKIHFLPKNMLVRRWEVDGNPSSPDPLSPPGLQTPQTQLGRKNPATTNMVHSELISNYIKYWLAIFNQFMKNYDLFNDCDEENMISYDIWQKQNYFFALLVLVSI